LQVIKEIPSLKRIHGPDPNYDDVCFSGAGRDVAEIHNFFPEIAMEFGNGQKLILSPENYLFRHTKVRGAYCLGIFPDRDSTTLLGGKYMQTRYTYLACFPIFFESIYHLCFSFKAEHVSSSLSKSSSVYVRFGFHV
jgi:hypothetical protein